MAGSRHFIRRSMAAFWRVATMNSTVQAMTDQGIEGIDLLVVNLYPFEQQRARTDDFATLIENIDIGGPAMLRAAAKNHEFVTVICDPR